MIAGPTILEAAPQPTHQGWEARWDELTRQYGDHAGVVVDYKADVELRFSTFDEPFLRRTVTITVAVLDRGRAEDALDRELLLWPGEKLKSIDVWGHERGSGPVVWAEKDDIQKRRLSGGLQLIRVPVPGISTAGVFGFHLVTESSQFSYLFEDFVSDFPLIKGQLRFTVPSVGSYRVQDFEKAFQSVYSIATFGNVEKIPAQVTDDGYTLVFRTADVPARPREAYSPASDWPRSEVHFLPGGFSWSTLVEWLNEELAQLKPPKAAMAAVRDSLKGSTPGDAVEAIARFLDDPDNFELTGGRRNMVLAFSDTESLWKRRRGDGLDKAILAMTLLGSLGIESRLVLAASEYRSDPNWRIYNWNYLNAALLWVPSLGKDYLWDLEDRSVPLGYAGPDLHKEMILVAPDQKSSLRIFPVYLHPQSERRRGTWTLGAEGELEGRLDCDIVGWPMHGDLDPWKTGQDLEQALTSLVPLGTAIREAAWSRRDDESLRCLDASPVTLSWTVAGEAKPHGESGWMVQPLSWPLPAPFRTLHTDARKSPVLIDRPMTMADSVVVRLGEASIVDIPSPVDIRNPAGAFECYWLVQEKAVLAFRRLSLKPVKAEGGELDALKTLCRAWSESAERGIVVR